MSATGLRCGHIYTLTITNYDSAVDYGLFGYVNDAYAAGRFTMNGAAGVIADQNIKICGPLNSGCSFT